MRYIALRKRGQQISPNKEESRRPAIYKLRRVYIHCFKRFLKFFVLFYLRKSRYRSFFLLTSDVDWKFDQWIVFTPKNENNCGGRASKLVSDKFICTYLGKANRLSVSFCGAVVMKVMDQKTLVKRRWSYKVRITVYILTPSEFCQTRVHKSLIGNLARHSFSLFDRNKTRPKTSKTSEWFNG